MMALKIALCQICSTNDKLLNFKICHNLIKQAKAQCAKIVFLPECFDFIAINKKESYDLAETLDGQLIKNYKDLAKNEKIWLSLGGFHQKVANESKMYNSHILIDDYGVIKSVYNKIHLFDLSIPEIVLKESDHTLMGEGLQRPIQTPIGKIGLQIVILYNNLFLLLPKSKKQHCYDIRFPIPAHVLRSRGGAHILTYPSAFTIPTGKMHWHCLNKARAIENQCYVISAAQVGTHNEKRSSYGHSLVVDPQGQILLDMGDETENINTVKIIELATSYPDFIDSTINKIRKNLPIETTWNMIKPGMYDLPDCKNEDRQIDLVPITNDIQFPFGPKNSIPPSCVFAVTPLSYAFVNRCPLLPGHTLVTTRRVNAQTLVTDCTPAEVKDMYALVQYVAKNALIKTYFTPNPKGVGENNDEPAFTITIQDGAAAGRTVPQVHIHVIPRHKGDLGSDDDNEIYRRLAKHDANSDKDERKWRTVENMSQEASIYRKMLYEQ